MEPNADKPKALDSKPEVKAEPRPEGRADPKPQGNTDVATLLNTSLGDLLVVGLVKDPEDAGRIIAAAITQAGASVTAAKAPEAKAAEPKLEAKLHVDEPKFEATAGSKPAVKADSKPETKAEPNPQPEAQADPKAPEPDRRISACPVLWAVQSERGVRILVTGWRSRESLRPPVVENPTWQASLRRSSSAPPAIFPSTSWCSARWRNGPALSKPLARFGAMGGALARGWALRPGGRPSN